MERALADDRPVDAERIAARYRARTPGNYIIGMLHARTLLRATRFAEALNVLRGLNVLPYEGSTDGRALYREANLMLAVQALANGRTAEAERAIAAAREWPRNLGAGKPYPDDVDERLEDWLLASSLDLRGAGADAKAARERVVAAKAPASLVGSLMRVLALASLGREAPARQAMQELRERDASLAAWAEQRVSGARAQPPGVGVATDEARVFAAAIGVVGPRAR